VDLAPSENHRFLLEQLRPALSYPGPDSGSWRSELRAKLLELLGLPARDGSPLNVRTLWQQEDELGEITKIVFTAERHADVPAYFCAPRDVEPPYRVAICLQGHTSGMHNSIGRAYDDETRSIDVPGDRDFALSAMRNGYAALCLEQRSFGYRGETEQQQVSDHGCHDAAMHALMLGRTILGERLFDVDRALDYLAGRGDIDMSGVGVLGNSGGGTVGIYSAALLDRIRFAMPGCSLATFAGSIMSIYHCADNYVPRLAQWADAGDILGLFAPKPVVVVAGRDDPIFPIAAVKEAFATVQRIYDDQNAGDRCALVIGAGGHRFYANEGWERLRSMNS
jgi:dienelactone hydrolase